MVATGASFADLKTALHQQYLLLVHELATKDPHAATDCAGWTVADVETHVAQTARGLARVAARAVTGQPDGGGVASWSEKVPTLSGEVDRMVREERGLPLAPQVDAVDLALATYPENTVVEQLTGRHTLKHATAFRLIEAVIHGLDVGIQPEGLALRLVVKELAMALADKHPGRSVEVRIPPYTAVQCLEGPRHTRGTPPNVVEAQPIAWLRLCAGREPWADLVRTGRITASGERSDLSPLMPLLG